VKIATLMLLFLVLKKLSYQVVNLGIVQEIIEKNLEDLLKFGQLALSIKLKTK